jgi:hypothetical protein
MEEYMKEMIPGCISIRFSSRFLLLMLLSSSSSSSSLIVVTQPINDGLWAGKQGGQDSSALCPELLSAPDVKWKLCPLVTENGTPNLSQTFM